MFFTQVSSVVVFGDNLAATSSTSNLPLWFRLCCMLGHVFFEAHSMRGGVAAVSARKNSGVSEDMPFIALPGFTGELTPAALQALFKVAEQMRAKITLVSIGYSVGAEGALNDFRLVMVLHVPPIVGTMSGGIGASSTGVDRLIASIITFHCFSLKLNQ